ncbi:MAG: B12-binding domain-containing protein [Oscillospiraceae bacterium]
MQEILKEIETAVYDGDEDLVVELTKKALEDGVEPQAIISDAGVPALNQLGEDFNNLIAFLPELMLGGDCMKALDRDLHALYAGC